MRVKELFEKDINRNISGVIKVDQVDNEDILYQELEEFIITKELSKHFATFYQNYNQSLEMRIDKVGVWISGDFGSGKSHFLKMLSYLLENKKVKDKGAVDFFADKDMDSMTLADMKRAASIPTETILFNIDSKSSSAQKQGKDGITEIFLKVFNAKLGYCPEITWLADIERTFDKDGIYEAFQDEFEKISGYKWRDVRREVRFREGEFIQALMRVKKISEDSAKGLIKNAKSEFSITPESFASLIDEYLRSKGPKSRLIFLVDEIGQYISDNTGLMLNLQTIVENLGSICHGRVWVMVTSQEAIDTITKERFRDQDFSKIQGRFDTKLSLSGANTDEVIKKRLLAKNPTGRDVLVQHYLEQEKILANLITFSSQTAGMSTYKNNLDFADCYPFIPYQFKLLQNVFSTLRKFSHSGAHLSQNERSMIHAFHIALKEYGDSEVGGLVPFYVFYGAIKAYIDTDITRIIDQAKEGNPDIEDFDIKVLIVLFLIKYIKEVPCDIENLASLMISHFNDSKKTLKSKIDGALTRLKKATLIQQNGELYDFLTNEEQDVNRGIKNTNIDPSEISDQLSKMIWDEIYTKSAFTLPPPHTNWKIHFSRWLDDSLKGSRNEDVEVRFITPLGADQEYIRQSSLGSTHILYIKLQDNGYYQELETIIKTEKYTRQSSAKTETQRRLISQKGEEISERKARVKRLLEQAIVQGCFISGGEDLNAPERNVIAKIDSNLKIVISNTYSKLNLIAEPLEKIGTRSASSALINPNQGALDEILAYLKMQNQAQQLVSMLSLKQRFGKKPYGWDMTSIAGLIVELAEQKALSIQHNGAPINPKDQNIERYLTHEKDIQSTIIKIKIQMDGEKIRKVGALIKEVFETYQIQEEGDALAEQIKGKLIPAWREKLKAIKEQYTNSRYPGRDVIDSGMQELEALSRILDANVLFDTLLEKSQDLTQWNKDFKLVKSFFENQKKIFDEALAAVNKIKHDQAYLDMLFKDHNLTSQVQTIEAILDLPKPYAEIKNLPPLTQRLNEEFERLLKTYKETIRKELDDLKNTISSEAQKAGLDPEKYFEKYFFIVGNYEQMSDFSSLKVALERAKQASDEALRQIHESSGRKLITIKPASYSSKILETQEDVDAYIQKLSAVLKERIKNHTIKLD